MIHRVLPIWMAVCLALSGLPGMARAGACRCGHDAPHHAAVAATPIQAVAHAERSAGDRPSCGLCCHDHQTRERHETPDHDDDTDRGHGCGCDGLCPCAASAVVPAVIRPGAHGVPTPAPVGTAVLRRDALSPTEVQLDLIRPPRA